MENKRKYINSSTYPRVQKDSAKAIESITKQKLQQVIDLSVLYSKNKKDEEIDQSLYNQLLGYFYEPDSTTIQPLINEIDSIKAESAIINKFENSTLITKKDTLNFVKFQVEYKNEDEEKIMETEHELQYILVYTPIKFQKEFKFYFLNYFSAPLNDSIRLGVTK